MDAAALEESPKLTTATGLASRPPLAQFHLSRVIYRGGEGDRLVTPVYDVGTARIRSLPATRLTRSIPENGF